MNSTTLTPLGAVAAIVGAFVTFIHAGFGLTLLGGGLAVFVAGRIIKDSEGKGG